MDEAGRSSVVVDNVTFSDAGTYVCIAENIVGSIRALSFVRIRGETSARAPSGQATEFSADVFSVFTCMYVCLHRASSFEGGSPHVSDHRPGQLRPAGLSNPRGPQSGHPLAP